MQNSSTNPITAYLGLDDTDTLETRGTGRLSRWMAGQLALDYPLVGITRHQLFVHPSIPYTAKNSCAVIQVKLTGPDALPDLFAHARRLMLDDHQPGSDPGLCAAAIVPEPVREFGYRARKEVLTQAEARRLAASYDLLLEGLGGSEDGVIGALAGVGLAAAGSDGRYLLIGHNRDLSGLVPVQDVLAAGIYAVRAVDESPVETGLIHADKLRPARRRGQPVQYVEWSGDHWEPVKLD